MFTHPDFAFQKFLKNYNPDFYSSVRKNAETQHLKTENRKFSTSTRTQLFRNPEYAKQKQKLEQIKKKFENGLKTANDQRQKLKEHLRRLNANETERQSSVPQTVNQESHRASLNLVQDFDEENTNDISVGGVAEIFKQQKAELLKGEKDKIRKALDSKKTNKFAVNSRQIQNQIGNTDSFEADPISPTDKQIDSVRVPTRNFEAAEDQENSKRSLTDFMNSKSGSRYLKSLHQRYQPKS